MPQDPQVIFRGTGLISGSSCEPIVLMASEEELSLSLGFGLRFKLAPQDVIKIEPVQEKQLSILHSSTDCPRGITCCIEESATEVITRINEIGFIPLGMPNNSVAPDGFPVLVERLSIVILLLLIIASAIARQFPIMARPWFGGGYLSLGVIPFFLFVSLMEIFPAFWRLFLKPGCYDGDIAYHLRFFNIILGLLSVLSIIALLLKKVFFLV